MKTTLSALVAALAVSMSGCSSNSAVSVKNPSQITQSNDGKYDSIDDYVVREDLDKMKDASYMVISESKYKVSNGETITLHSLGTAVLYKDVNARSYLATANHVVSNEETLYDFFGNKYEKLSEQFYLLEDHDVDLFHRSLRNLAEREKSELYYMLDASGRMIALHNIVETSDEIASILSVIKPKNVKVDAYNEAKDLAIISVPKLAHQPLAYSIGNAKELQIQNVVYVTGWPRGLVKNVTSGHVTSVHDSRLVRDDPDNNFLFDAAISPGNSGGGIFAVRDGKLELVGITTAMYLGANSMYIGVKINGISEVFKESSISCINGWGCNFSAPSELKL